MGRATYVALTLTTNISVLDLTVVPDLNCADHRAITLLRHIVRDLAGVVSDQLKHRISESYLNLNFPHAVDN